MFLILNKSKLPFAIVGSNTILEADGKSFRGRQYPWGVVNSELFSSTFTNYLKINFNWVLNLIS